MAAKSPAVALPSSGAELISVSCWSESFGLDQSGLVAQVDEGGTDGFDEWRWPAHEAVGSNLRGPADFGEQVAVDATAAAGPRRRGFPGEGEGDGSVSAIGQRGQLVAVDDVVDRSSRVHELHCRRAGEAGVVTHHRHKRHHTRAAADEQYWSGVVAVPHEPPADRAAHLEL